MDLTLSQHLIYEYLERIMWYIRQLSKILTKVVMKQIYIGKVLQ